MEKWSEMFAESDFSIYSTIVNGVCILNRKADEGACLLTELKMCLRE